MANLYTYFGGRSSRAEDRVLHQTDIHHVCVRTVQTQGVTGEAGSYETRVLEGPQHGTIVYAGTLDEALQTHYRTVDQVCTVLRDQITESAEAYTVWKETQP